VSSHTILSIPLFSFYRLYYFGVTHGIVVIHDHNVRLLDTKDRLNTVSHAHHVATIHRIGIVLRLLFYRALPWPYTEFSERTLATYPSFTPCSLLFDDIKIVSYNRGR